MALTVLARKQHTTPPLRVLWVSLALHPSRVEVGDAGGTGSLETETVTGHFPSSFHHPCKVALSSWSPLDLSLRRPWGSESGVSSSELRVAVRTLVGKDTLPTGQSKGCLRFPWPRCGLVGVEGRGPGAGLYPRPFPERVRGSYSIGKNNLKTQD